MEDNIYSIGTCEHTAQLWNFNLNNGKSYIIDFTYSTYPRSNTDDAVYFPRDIERVENTILLASNLRNGPTIQSVENNSTKLKTRWQGKKADGNLISMRFVGNNGWMITSKNRLLHSADGGSTWQYLPDLSSLNSTSKCNL